MRCILCIMAGLQDTEIHNAEELRAALATAVDGAETAVTITRGNALCNKHIASEVLGFAI